MFGKAHILYMLITALVGVVIFCLCIFIYGAQDVFSVHVYGVRLRSALYLGYCENSLFQKLSCSTSWNYDAAYLRSCCERAV